MIGARPAEIIAHGRAAGLERTGQAAGIGSRRPCQGAVLIAGDPARPCDPASAYQAMRTRPLLPSGHQPRGPARPDFPASAISALASSAAGVPGLVWAPARSARLTRTAAIVMMRAISMIPADTSNPRPTPPHTPSSSLPLLPPV